MKRRERIKIVKINMNKGQWAVIGIVCFIIGVNVCIVIRPVDKSLLWSANVVLLCLCSGLYYVLRSRNI